jgi:hypothetical protein
MKLLVFLASVSLAALLLVNEFTTAVEANLATPVGCFTRTLVQEDCNCGAGTDGTYVDREWNLSGHGTVKPLAANSVTCTLIGGGSCQIDP